MWKEIKGIKETYLINENGIVKTKSRKGARGYNTKERTHKQWKNSSGYYRVSMNLEGKSKEYLVHRLVAREFVDNPNNYDFINHIDGNKENNNCKNLEWCTRSQNEQHAWKIGLKKREMFSHKGEQHPMHKLNKTQIDFIRSHHKAYDKTYGTIPLSKMFNVTPQTITDVVHKRTWIETLPYSELIVGD